MQTEEITQLSQTVDRMLNTVVKIDATQGEVVARLAHLEEQHARTFEKLDGFLMLINRHEAEIVALTVSIERVRDRLSILEKQKS